MSFSLWVLAHSFYWGSLGVCLEDLILLSISSISLPSFWPVWPILYPWFGGLAFLRTSHPLLPDFSGSSLWYLFCPFGLSLVNVTFSLLFQILFILTFSFWMSWDHLHHVPPVSAVLFHSIKVYDAKYLLAFIFIHLKMKDLCPERSVKSVFLCHRSVTCVAISISYDSHITPPVSPEAIPGKGSHGEWALDAARAGLEVPVVADLPSMNG